MFDADPGGNNACACRFGSCGIDQFRFKCCERGVTVGERRRSCCQMGQKLAFLAVAGLTAGFAGAALIILGD